MKVKNIIKIVSGVLLAVMPSVTNAQVDKTVEVTKDYQPVLYGAMKLPVVPDMADTVKMRPEIDYGITPLMYSPELVTAHSFKPATVTYWDFNRPTNFYLKMGVGYPINTVGDFFMSTYNVRTGYLMAAANHYGEFGKQNNWFGDRRNILKASTTGRIAGGVYVGQRMFEGEVAYDSEVARRYAAPLNAFATNDSGVAEDPNLKAEYEVFKLKLRLGDDFQDLSRTNFNIDFFGDFFHDKSDWREADYKLQMFDFGVGGKVGRRFQRHYLEGDVRYKNVSGIKDLRNHDNTVWAGLRYGYTASRIDLLVGADYCYDKPDVGHHYVLPYAKLLLNVTRNDSFIPFVEAEGVLKSNDYYSLARHTIYVRYSEDMTLLPNTLKYDFRAGFAGKFGRGRFGYRLYVGYSIADNALYWYNYNYEWLQAVAAKQQVLTLNAELDYRPIDEIIVSAGIHGRFFKDYGELYGFDMANGESPLEALLKFRYRHRKFSVGASARICGAAEWTVMHSFTPEGAEQPIMNLQNEKMPMYVDAGVDFEWNLKEDWKIFVEGSNLANMKIYDPAYFRQQGIRCTAGFKFTF